MRVKLKEREMLNKLMLSRQLSHWLGFKVFQGRKKLRTGKENEKGCQKNKC